MNTGRTHFKKGHIPWCKGKSVFIGKDNPFYGKKHTEETKRKIREARARQIVIRNEETKQKISKSLQGHPCYKDSDRNRKLSESGKRRIGEKAGNWRGGITPENTKIRCSHEYKQWRRIVFIRDDFTCQICGMRGTTIHADHIKAFSKYPELRFELSNGRTLCVPCHRKTDTWGGKSV